MNKLEAMRAFTLICEKHSFAAAAKEMHLSATMVSRYIKQLEEHLGCLLLKRNTRKVLLTEAGEQYRQQITPLLKKLNIVEQQISHYSDVPQGHLNISASIEFGGIYLAPLVGLYRQQYPQVKLAFNLLNTPVDLLSSDIDLVFRVAPQLPDSSFIAQPVCTTRLALWASPEYLANAPSLESIDHLHQHQLLFFNHSVRKEQWIFNQANKQQQIKLPWAWRSNNGRLLNEAAATGQGIIQAPAYSVASYVAKGQLREVLPQHSISPMNISAIYSHRYDLSCRIKTFVTMAKDYFITNPLPQADETLA